MLKEFKAFVLRGNVIDLAVGVVIGAAFGAVVTAFVENLLTPLISIPGKTNFDRMSFTVGGGVFKYGAFINALITFLLIAAALFFFVVKPVNALMARRRTEPDVASTTKACPECLSKIPKAARRCAFCTSEQPA
ncbi:MAG TPA: large conductance mechanosensitive channel protein MscL [Actinomycetota bacterium]|jgi:large conductance mechanosensitive channel